MLVIWSPIIMSLLRELIDALSFVLGAKTNNHDAMNTPQLDTETSLLECRHSSDLASLPAQLLCDHQKKQQQC